jgi:hypothetical protein
MRVATLILLAALSFSAAASQPERQPPDTAEILSNQEVIRDEMNAKKGVFKTMPERERQDLLARSTRVTTLLDGRQWTDLADDEQLEVFNSLEAIKAAVEDAQDNRLVCEQKKRPGSNLTYKSCKTVAMKRREREQAARLLESAGQCVDPTACSGTP